MRQRPGLKYLLSMGYKIKDIYITNRSPDIITKNDSQGYHQYRTYKFTVIPTIISSITGNNIECDKSRRNYQKGARIYIIIEEVNKIRDPGIKKVEIDKCRI